MKNVEPAALWRREAAHLVDGLVGIVVWGLLSMWLVLGMWALRGWPRNLSELVLLVLLIEALALVLHVVYHVVFVGGCGQTPGKMALGIAVVRREGGRAGYGRATLRVLGGAISVLTLGIGHAAMLLSRERRGLSDWMAGTRVVRN